MSLIWTLRTHRLRIPKSPYCDPAQCAFGVHVIRHAPEYAPRCVECNLSPGTRRSAARRMSWLFGYRNSQPQDFTQFVQPPPPAGDGGGGGGSGSSGSGGGVRGGSGGSQMEAYRFDSSALERAAAAAKELERSSTMPFSRRFHTLFAKSRAHGYVSGRLWRLGHARTRSILPLSRVR